MLQTDYFLLVALGYAQLTIAVGAFEARRIRASGPDLVSVFIALFVIECCLPGVAIYASLPFVDARSPTDVGAFDRIYTAVDLPAALLVLALTAWFAFFFYAFTALGRRMMSRVLGSAPVGSRLVLRGSSAGLLIALALGLALSLVSFYVLGASWLERYTNLILFRAGSPEIQRTVLTAFGFGLTQTWTWLCLPAIFVMYERRGRRLPWVLCLFLLGAFMLLGVSRRALLIPIVLTYLTLLLFDGRWRLKWVVAAAVPALLLVAFGKEMLGVLAFHGSLSDVFGRYQALSAGVLRAASEIGLTDVESLGTINLMHLPTRFGIDHLLSLFRSLPGDRYWLAWPLPGRIVRLSTAAFAAADSEDIPPGLFGQMWMDFGVFGPVVWAFALALPLSVAQHVFAATIRTRQAASVFALVAFVIALPLNTGSYDFTFSADIYALIFCLLLTFRFVRVRLPTANEAAGRPP